MNFEDDIQAYQENALKNIENSISFENQKLKGQIIEKNGTYTCFGGSRYLNSFRIKKAKQYAEGIGQRLHIDSFVVGQAFRVYLLVQKSNWIQGRSTSLVILACLYLKCRENETGHLMIDFSNESGTDIFQLSKIYLKLCRFMHFTVKLNDPSIYVPRFLKQLNFPKDKQNLIRDYVLRLLSRMRKDWLGQGRRPTGLIAAGFYIASKCYKVEKSLKEIATVLKVSDETIRKRVNEFRNLKVAQLTKEQFLQLPYLNLNLDEEDPPAFKRKRLLSLEKKKQEQLMIEQASKNQQNSQSEQSLEKYSQLEKNINDPSYLEQKGREIALQQNLNNSQIQQQDNQNNNYKIQALTNKDISWLDDKIIDKDEFEDNEIDLCLLKPFEIKVKTIAWNKQNKDWIEEQQQKILRAKESKQNPQERRKKARQNNIKKQRPKKVSVSKDELVQKIMEQGKIGNLNTSMLEKLFQQSKQSQTQNDNKQNNQFQKKKQYFKIKFSYILFFYFMQLNKIKNYKIVQLIFYKLILRLIIVYSFLFNTTIFSLYISINSILTNQQFL